MRKFSSKYYETTKSNKYSPLLDEALAALQTDGKSALDLGSGVGRDTKHLADNGFHVTAVDAEPSVAQYVDHLGEKVEFVSSKIEDFEFGRYDIINASYSLPFCPADKLPTVIEKIIESLRPGGVFTGQLFGDQDAWNIPGGDTTCYTREQAENLFAQLELIKIDEENNEHGELSDGSPKHWHIFNIIARKKAI